MQQVSIKGQILAYVEHSGASVDGASLNLLVKVRALANSMSAKVIAVVVGQPGHDVGLDALAQNGVDGLLVVEHPDLAQYNPELFSKIMADIVRDEQPRMFLAPHTVIAMEIASSVAGRLGIPPITNCLDIEMADGKLLVTRPMFGGTRHVRTTVEGSPIIGTLRSKVWPSSQLQAGGPAIRRYDPSTVGDLLTRIKVLSTIEPDKGDLGLNTAELIVSIGRGIGTKANIPMYRELAEALGGVLGCSRPLVDLSWLPKEHQVGISGNTVKPKVYLACGISGAYQHIAGMQESQTIIAVNNDPTAPIFEVAQYGAVADLSQVAPRLLELAKATR